MTGRVFKDDDSVHQVDKASSVAGSQQPGQKASPRGFPIELDKDKTKDKPAAEKPIDNRSRSMRTPMDPQQREALDKDLAKIKKGSMTLNEGGLLSFNRFMHLFIIITRHSKEQHIKETRKQVEKRRRAYTLKNWKEYNKIV